MRWLTAFLILSIAASMSCAAVIVDEPFDGTSTPQGWTIQGYYGGSHTDPGTAKDDSDFFQDNSGNPKGYLELTTPRDYDRTSAYYTDQMVSSRGWTVNADVYIGGGTGADGLAFTFVDQSTISGSDDLAGGYGEWIGAPHGTDSSKSVGYVEGVEGYAFEFDHYQNSNEITQEYTHFVDINTWDHISGAARDFQDNPDFYYGNGWVNVTLENRGDDFTFSWDDNRDGTTDGSYNFTVSNFPQYDAYLGVTGSTGAENADHWAKDVQMDGTPTPEPGTLVLMGLGLAGVGFIKRRRDG